MLLPIAPYFGYLASLCLVISLVVNNDLRFRWFNSIGCVAFIIYAIVLGAIPVLLTNTILLCINVYYLIKIYSRQEIFDLVEFKAGEKMPAKFIGFYRNDIRNYFPNFDEGVFNRNLNFAVTRDVVISNIFSAEVTPGGDAIVELNYTLPRFRDYKVGTFIFEKEKDYLLSKAVKRIVYHSVSHKGHLDFLKKNGFKQEAVDGRECWTRNITAG